MYLRLLGLARIRQDPNLAAHRLSAQSINISGQKREKIMARHSSCVTYGVFRAALALVAGYEAQTGQVDVDE